MNRGNRKGASAEELLRSYFLSAGYFVVRGVPVGFRETEITDLDLWLYHRPTAATRHRACVDAKNKAKPKALERILWAKGIQTVLGLDQAMVATTDKRPEIKAYGSKSGVKVLSGDFLRRIQNLHDANRLSEESLIAPLRRDKGDKLYDGWSRRLSIAKARLLTQLDFDGCNAWLEDLRFFLEQHLIDKRSELAGRLAYLMAAYFSIALDFALVDLAFESEADRQAALAEGFRYGDGGAARSESVLEKTTMLVEAFAPRKGKALASKIRAGLDQQAKAFPVEILADYFSRTQVMKCLFSTAIEFECLAYASSFKRPSEISVELRSNLAVFLDFFGLDRRRFLGQPATVQPSVGSQSELPFTGAEEVQGEPVDAEAGEEEVTPSKE